MFKRKGKALPPKALAPEFDAAVELWRQAELDVHAALARFRTVPDPVNRLAVIMAWAAFEMSLKALSGWIKEHPPAIDATTWAHARSEALHIEIRRAGFIEKRPIFLD
ncbi:hypothetical protein, partial [Reyranella sp.]|jgi:hypothetical protein|uniref:hypothetical protein n=1 Tax=Reyranella sp. TaxID=1929291 RepID=UPI002F943537